MGRRGGGRGFCAGLPAGSWGARFGALRVSGYWFGLCGGTRDATEAAEGAGNPAGDAEAGKSREHAPQDGERFRSGDDGGEVAYALLRGGVAVGRVAGPVLYRVSIVLGMGE